MQNKGKNKKKKKDRMDGNKGERKKKHRSIGEKLKK